MSQNEAIFEYLKQHQEGITPLDALEKFRCLRLGAHIHDIKAELPPDQRITSTLETKNGKTYARYKLEVSHG